jgi:chemotaxis protein MotB
MKSRIFLIPTLSLALFMSACVSKKKFVALEESHKKEMEVVNSQLGKCGEELNRYLNDLAICRQEKEVLKSSLMHKDEQIQDTKKQVEDARTTRDKQMEQVGNLTVMTQAANDNMRQTLSQLEQKDKYISLLQAAKTKADSINLALSYNLKSALKEGLADKDIEVKVDKTVVFVNLSDKMLFQSGSSNLTLQANEVLGKIAKILEGRKDLEVMVEGYTDNLPISNDCIKDNWDLSTKRATAVVRVLQNVYKVDPNKLIAAGRGQYNTLASNDTPEGRTTNRRTRIIILPKLDQFYDLLNPNSVPK